MRRTIYISGPMTGIKDFNYPAFNAKEKELKAQGHKVENPASNDPLNSEGVKKSWAEFMCDALKQLERSTHILYLDGWANSPGALIESIAADRIGLKHHG